MLLEAESDAEPVFTTINGDIKRTTTFGRGRIANVSIYSHLNPGANCLFAKITFSPVLKSFVIERFAYSSAVKADDPFTADEYIDIFVDNVFLTFSADNINSNLHNSLYPECVNNNEIFKSERINLNDQSVILIGDVYFRFKSPEFPALQPKAYIPSTLNINILAEAAEVSSSAPHIGNQQTVHGHHLKPHRTWELLLAEIFEASSKPSLTVNQIYKEVETAYPYFAGLKSSAAWKGGVRHALTKYPCFIRLDKNSLKGSWKYERTSLHRRRTEKSSEISFTSDDTIGNPHTTTNSDRQAVFQQEQFGPPYQMSTNTINYNTFGNPQQQLQQQFGNQQLNFPVSHTNSSNIFDWNSFGGALSFDPAEGEDDFVRSLFSF